MGAQKYAMVETATVHIRDAGDELMYAEGADGKPDLDKPMRITMYGPGTKEYRRASVERAAAALKKQAKGARPEQIAEAALGLQIEFLAKTTHSFENMEELYSEPGLSGRKAFLDVYGNDSIAFVRDQAGALGGDTANFKPGSSKS